MLGGVILSEAFLARLLMLMTLTGKMRMITETEAGETMMMVMREIS